MTDPWVGCSLHISARAGKLQESLQAHLLAQQSQKTSSMQQSIFWVDEPICWQWGLWGLQCSNVSPFIYEHVDALGEAPANRTDILVRFWLEFSAVQLEWHMDPRLVCMVYVPHSTRVIPLINEGGSVQMKGVFEKRPQSRPSCLQEDPWHAWHCLSYAKCCQQMLLQSACQSERATKSYQKLCFAAGFLLIATQQNCFLNFPSTEVFWDDQLINIGVFLLAFCRQASFCCSHPLLGLAFTTTSQFWDGWSEFLPRYPFGSVSSVPSPHCSVCSNFLHSIFLFPVSCRSVFQMVSAIP